MAIRHGKRTTGDERSGEQYENTGVGGEGGEGERERLLRGANGKLIRSLRFHSTTAMIMQAFPSFARFLIKHCINIYRGTCHYANARHRDELNRFTLDVL